MSVPFSVVDVFSSTAYKGNPLAVIDNTTAGLTTNQMQLIARQFNLSETTFFEPPTKSSAYMKLRSFYPDGTEVFGSGHNILGVWWYLAQKGKLAYEKAEKVREGTWTFNQELGENVSPVEIVSSVDAEGEERFSVSVRQASPGSHDIHPDIESLAKSVGLKKDDLSIMSFVRESEDSFLKPVSLTPRVMSTASTRHLIVPVLSNDALKRLTVQRDTLAEQLALADDAARGIYFFTRAPEESSTSFEARFFSTGMSAEDPATGSAAGPLAAFLHGLGLLNAEKGESVDIEVRQGLMTGRDCLIKVTLTNEGKVLNVDITGTGAEVMNGTLAAPTA